MTHPNNPNPWQRQDASASNGSQTNQAGGDMYITTLPPSGPRRSPGKGIAFLAVAVAAACIGALVAVKLTGGLGQGWNSQQGPSAGQDASSGTTVDPKGRGPGAGGPAAAPSSPQPSREVEARDSVRFSGTVRLVALNLDTKPPTVRSSDGIDGFQVLYPNLDAQGATAFGTAGDLLFQHPALAPYTGSSTPSRQACAELLQSQAVQMLRVEEGDRLCVETSAGRIAFIVFGKFTSGAFLGTATVWEAVG